MADLSYLFGNSVPSSITSGTTTTNSSLPDWLQDYTKGLMGNATQVAGEAYQPYTGARIADQTPDQVNAAQGVRDAQGQWQPGIDFASGGINSQGIDPRTGLPTGGSNIQNYMNPYMDQVVNRIGDLGQRNFTERLLPQINSTFSGSGQFGSDRNMDFLNQGVRDTNESILGQQASALNTGFQNAVTNFQNDATRVGNAANMGQTLSYQDIGMLDASGQKQQNIGQQSLDQGYQDFMAQQNYPKQNLDWLSQIMRGLPAQNQQTEMMSKSAPITTMSPLQQAAAAFAGTRSALTGPSVPAVKPA